jgi:predicted nuclease with TOPRIM domain
MPPEENEVLEIDVDAIADDKLRSTLGKVYHELKKTRTQSAGYRTAKNALEGERDQLKTKLETATSASTTLEQQIADLSNAKTALETERDGLTTKVTDFETLKAELEGKIETANRSSGQHLANFKKRALDAAIADALVKANVVDNDAALALLKRDGITVDDETFEVKGVDEAFTTLLTEKPALKKAEPGPRGTNAGGLGPFGGGGGGGGGQKFTDFRDPDKTLDQLERESNLAKYGIATISGA